MGEIIYRIGDHMIKNLAIENYKAFKNLSLNGLSRVNIIGGKNNAGKSTLLEAIFMFYDRLNPQMILRQFVRRGLNVISVSPETIWQPIFYNYDQTKVIKVKLDTSANEELILRLNPKFLHKSMPVTQTNLNVKLDNAIMHQRGPVVALDVTCHKNNQLMQKTHLIVNENEMGMLNEIIINKPTPAIYLSSRAQVSQQEDAQRFGMLDVEGKTESIVRFLKVIEPRLNSLSTIAIGDTSIVHGDIGIGRKLPISFMGDGMSRLLSIILAIATTQNGVVLIDEIENGIHYSAMKEIWKSIAQAAREYNCQVFATTHSYECITSANLALKELSIDEFQYIRLTKSGSNIISKSYDLEILSTAINAELEVR